MLHVLIALFFTLLQSGVPVCVTFDKLKVGAQFGSPSGQSPGDLVFIENNVKVFVEEYEDPSGVKKFSSTHIQKAGAFGNGNVIFTNYMNLSFALKGKRISKVTIDYFEENPNSNFSVNGSKIFSGRLNGIPSSIIRGVHVKVSYAAKGKNHIGKIELTGLINRVTIGGTELSLDNICISSIVLPD